MNLAAKGARGERQIIAQLEAEGWECYKSAASKGSFDVIALRWWTPRNLDHPFGAYTADEIMAGRMEIKLVQVKRFGARRGYGVKSLLADLADWTGLAWVEAWLAERQDGQKAWVWTEAKRSE